MITHLVAVCIAAATAVGQDRAPSQALLQVEVGDSIGLPLPDAKVEVYTLMDRGIYREWVWVDPSSVPEGIHLLRFSYPGYRASVFSVPLRKGTRVSLRVRLGAPPDTTNRNRAVEVTDVHAIGILMEGRSKSDFIRTRRVLDRDAIERGNAASIVALLRDARGTKAIVTGGTGSAMIGLAAEGGIYGCPMPVIVNGDRRMVTTFAEASARYTPDEVEAIELIPRTTVAPYVLRVEEGGCGVLALWVK